jgi:hypothetical protein
MEFSDFFALPAIIMFFLGVLLAASVRSLLSHLKGQVASASGG